MSDILANAVLPLDYTGRAASNKITGELHNLTQANWRTYHTLIPKKGPYFEESLVIKYRDTGGVLRPLVMGQDWVPSHWFISASTAVSKQLYGSITIINAKLAGTLEIDYQSIGGEWVLDLQEVQTKLAEKLLNPITTSWEVLTDLPKVFPPNPHTHDINDFSRFDDLVVAVRDVAETIRNKPVAPSNGNTRPNQPSSPAATKASVGLGLVANLAILPEARVATENTNNFYMTPKTTRLMIERFAIDPLNTLKADRNNILGVTAAQVGAYTKQEVNNLLNQKLSTNAVAYDSQRLGGKDLNTIKSEVAALTAANATRFNNKTYDEVMRDAESRAGALTTFGGKNPTEFKSWVQEGLSLDNAVKFNNRTDTQFVTWLSSNSSLNAAKAFGLTKQQLLEEFKSESGWNADQVAGRNLDGIRQYVFNGYQPYNTSKEELIREVSTKTIETLKTGDLSTNNLVNTVKGALAGQLDAKTLEGQSLSSVQNRTFKAGVSHFIPRRTIVSTTASTGSRKCYLIATFIKARIDNRTHYQFYLENVQSGVVGKHVDVKITVDSNKARSGQFGRSLIYEVISNQHTLSTTEFTRLMEILEFRFIEDGTNIKLYLFAAADQGHIQVNYSTPHLAAMIVPDSISHLTDVTYNGTTGMQHETVNGTERGMNEASVVRKINEISGTRESSLSTSLKQYVDQQVAGVGGGSSGTTGTGNIPLKQVSVLDTFSEELDPSKAYYIELNTGRTDFRMRINVGAKFKNNTYTIMNFIFTGPRNVRMTFENVGHWLNLSYGHGTVEEVFRNEFAYEKEVLVRLHITKNNTGRVFTFGEVIPFLRDVRRI